MQEHGAGKKMNYFLKRAYVGKCCMISQVCIMESFLIWNCLILLFHTLRALCSCSAISPLVATWKPADTFLILMVPQTCRDSVSRNSIIVIINLSTDVCVMRNSVSWPRSAKETRLTNTCRSAGLLPAPPLPV